MCVDPGMARGGPVGVVSLPFLSAGAPSSSRHLNLACDITGYCLPTINVRLNLCLGGEL